MACASAQARPSGAGLRFLGLAAALVPSPALAGAWDPPAGGQLILEARQGEQAGAEQSELQAYAEAPVSGGAQVAKLWLRHTPDWDETRFEAMAGRRWRFEAPAAAAAVQGALITRGEASGPAEFGAEARLLGGWSIGDDAFVGAEVALQLYPDGAEPRLEATLGHTTPRRLTFLQLRYDQDREEWGYARAEAAVVLFAAGGLGLQLGVRAGLDHDERAFTIGLWRAPAPR